MYWSNILFYNISLLAKNNNISRKEIDDYFYQTGKELAYFYSPDVNKVNDFFVNNNSLESKLALSWMAFDIETVKKTASTYNKIKKVSTKKKILFKEILLTENGIKCFLVDEVTNEINEKIKSRKGRIDYEYLFEKQIEDLKDGIASIEYITNNINNDLINIWKKLNTILKDKKVDNTHQSFQEYESIVDNIYKIPSYYSIESHLFDFETNYVINEDLIDFTNSLKKIFNILKLKNLSQDYIHTLNIINNYSKWKEVNNIDFKKAKEFAFEINEIFQEDIIIIDNNKRNIILSQIFQKEIKLISNIFNNNFEKDIDFYLKEIYGLFTKELSAKLRTFKIRLKHRQNWLDMYKLKNIVLDVSKINDSLLFNNTYSKTNTLYNNELIFNNISQFVSKYLSSYYKIEDKKISLQDPQNYFINDFDITSDMINDLDFKNTYNLKYKFLENETWKLDFISSILFYKNNIINSTYEEILDTDYIDYIKVKENILQINYNSFNNSNKIYLLKDDLEKLLKSIHKELSIEKFWNLFYCIELSDEEIKSLKNKDTVYYGIQDKNWKNLSNLNQIQEVLKSIIIDEKLNNSSNFSEILEEIYNKVLWLIENNIAIVWLSLSWRKNINKGTSTTTSILNLYEKVFLINYAKFYQWTKDKISTNIYIFDNITTNISYLEDEFNKCIDNTFDTIMEKIDERIRLYFEKDITSIVV